MIIIKRFVKTLTLLTLLMITAVTAHAYNVVNLPEDMTFADAFGIFSADELTRVTVSDIADGKYIELTNDEISEFYLTAKDMMVYRTVNPTPFRGIAVNIFTNDGEKSYYLNSGIEIGLYGSANYICYKLDRQDTEKLLYLDSMYKDSDKKNNGDVLNRDTGKDFLKLPSAAWAQSFVKEAAAKSLIPYEFTNIYSDNISREQFCILLANMIAVKENYVSLDMYMQDRGQPYLKNYFDDCKNADNSINILYALGIVNGRDESSFDPYGTISREEAAALLCKTAEQYMWIGAETSLNYSDAQSISEWARFYVTWTNEYGIMTGVTETEFAPHDSYTVEQAIATIVRLYNLIQ